MPHSLRARLSGLRYKKIISDKDYDRLCKALDNEGVIDKIKAEIEHLTYCWSVINPKSVIDDVLEIIDKYKAESEE